MVDELIVELINNVLNLADAAASVLILSRLIYATSASRYLVLILLKNVLPIKYESPSTVRLPIISVSCAFNIINNVLIVTVWVGSLAILVIVLIESVNVLISITSDRSPTRLEIVLSSAVTDVCLATLVGQLYGDTKKGLLLFNSKSAADPYFRFCLSAFANESFARFLFALSRRSSSSASILSLPYSFSLYRSKINIKKK